MAFFAGATNVDARGGTYSYINGSQVNYIGISTDIDRNRLVRLIAYWQIVGRYGLTLLYGPALLYGHRLPPTWKDDKGGQLLKPLHKMMPLILHGHHIYIQMRLPKYHHLCPLPRDGSLRNRSALQLNQNRPSLILRDYPLWIENWPSLSLKFLLGTIRTNGFKTTQSALLLLLKSSLH